MKIQNGIKYESNYARAAAYFLGSCAERPDGLERAAAYDFITGFYSQIMNYPESMGLKPQPDVYFEPWEQQKERQKDVKIIRDSIKKVETLISELYKLTTESSLDGNSFILAQGSKLSRTLLKALATAGALVQDAKIIFPDGCAIGLKELAEISANNVIPITDSPLEDKVYLYFSRCVFEPDENWTAVFFDRMLGADGQLVALCHELEKRGYKRVDCKDGKRVSLDYIKLYAKKDAPLKTSWADKIHSGIELSYEDLRLEPCFFWLRMPDFKTVLERINELPEDVSDFIIQNTKTCDCCRYCVQTDKTGTRPLAAIPAGSKKKCPYYPSFTMNWRSFNAELSKNILRTLDTVYPDAK